MKNKACQIRKIVRNVAALEAVRQIRLGLMVLLLMEFFLRTYYRCALSGLMFLLLWLVVGPFVIGQFLRKDKTKEQASLLPVFCKKYRYSQKELYSQMITCVVCLFYFVIQQYANINSSITEYFIIFAPTFYFIGMIIGFISLYFHKRKKLGNILENNQL